MDKAHAESVKGTAMALCIAWTDCAIFDRQIIDCICEVYAIYLFAPYRIDLESFSHLKLKHSHHPRGRLLLLDGTDGPSRYKGHMTRLRASFVNRHSLRGQIVICSIKPRGSTPPG